jgi:hypothetical protein
MIENRATVSVEAAPVRTRRVALKAPEPTWANAETEVVPLLMMPALNVFRPEIVVAPATGT